MFNLTPLVKNLLIINILMFIIPEVFLPDHHLFVEFFGLRYVLSSSFLPTQLLSYSLIHASWSHLFSNMFGLLIFGPILESTLGPKKFLLFYFITAIGAGVFYSIIHLFEVYPFIEQAGAFLKNQDADEFARLLSSYSQPLYERNLPFILEYSRNTNNPAYQMEAARVVEGIIDLRQNTPMVGASGAIFGVMMGFGYLYPNLKMMLLFPPIPIQAKYLVGFYGIYALYSAIEKVPGDNVAHYAHLGGMVVGYLLLRFWKTHPNHY